MEYKRYIFLDVDGVLNHPEFYNKTRVKAKHKRLSELLSVNSHIDPEKIQLLNQLENCEKELRSIELTADKSKRQRWRELNKLVKHYKSILKQSGHTNTNPS